MIKKSKLSAFFKGIVIAFSAALVIEGGIIAWQYVSMHTEEIYLLASGITDTISTDGPMSGEEGLDSSDDLSDPENTGETLSFDETKYPYRQLLNSSQQEVYNQIYANAMAYNTDAFSLVEQLTTDELCETMNCVFNDHPEIFWLNTSYKYGSNSSNKAVQVQLSYGISASDLETAKSSYNSVVSEIVEGASAYSSEIEIELYIHDAICSIATYNTNASLNQSAYSALVNGSTVCAGYARAFQNVCQEAGLTCYYITGTGNGEDHAWNIVSIDGDFYNVDITWDDSISESYGSSVYTYFNLTDEKIGNDHTRSELSSKLPSCTATAMSYTNVYGSTIEIDDISNENNRPITDGDFKINEPKEPVVEWRDQEIGAKPEGTGSTENTVPENTVSQPAEKVQSGEVAQPQGGAAGRMAGDRR